MTTLAVERIKLFSTRSPAWCIGIAVVLTIGFAALFAALAPADQVNIPGTQFGSGFGLPVVLILATLAATTEYRFGTIRATFLATPNRTKVVLGKAGLMAIVCAIIGLVTAFASWLLAMVIEPSADLALKTSGDWRALLGVPVMYALGAVVAIAIGLLLRHTAGAIALILIYTQAIEGIITQIPRIGDPVGAWLPFLNMNYFIFGSGSEAADEFATGGVDFHWGPWGGLVYFVVFTLVMLVFAIVVVNRRDA